MSTRCEICDQLANGNHFGVLTCRACAAFFRRGAKNLKKYKCKSDGAGGKCAIFTDDKYNCKKCRLEKCLKVGMSVEKFQYGRDLIVTNIERSPVKRKWAISSVDPFFIYLTEKSVQKTCVELKYLLAHAEMIFERRRHQTTIKTGGSQLRRLCHAQQTIREQPTSSNFLLLKQIGRNERLKFWEQYFVTVTRWLTAFDEFQSVTSVTLKMDILKTMWHVWVQMDKLAMNVTARRRGLCDENAVMVGYNCYVDLTEKVLDTSWCLNYDSDKVAFFVEQIDWNLTSLIAPMMSLNPSEMEVTFMISQLCFNYAGKRLQGAALEVCDRFLKTLSDDVHDYYVNEMKMPRYSARLAQLMKFVRLIEADILEKRWKTRVSDVFNVWKLEFSHPEAFFDNSC